ncbi:MAG: hypothetical protein V4597_19300 [Pseudomonadota bacterium]
MVRKPETQIDEMRRNQGTRPDQPRGYLISFFIGDRQWEDKRPYFIDADLTPGVALQQTAGKLDAVLRGFIAAASVRKPEEIRTCRLELTEWGNTAGRPDLVWTVSWDPE